MQTMYLVPTETPPLADWIGQVDSELTRRFGFDHSSFNDWPWVADYYVGATPRESVAGWARDNLHS